MAKKDKPAKLPKRIAGVKLPKQLRSSPVAVWLYNNEMVREMVASALLAGSAALVNNPKARRAAAAVLDRAGETVTGTARRAKRTAARAPRLLTTSRSAKRRRSSKG
jgi:hypothetical protein